MTMRNRLIKLSILKRGNWFLMYEALRQDPKLTQFSIEPSAESLFDDIQTRIVTIVDEEYPSYFKQMEMPPFVLYYQGDLNLLKEKKIGIMGTNRPSTYGMKSCQTLVAQLINQNIVIVGVLPC